MRAGAVFLAVTALLVVPAGAMAVPDGGTVLIDRPPGFGALPFDGVNTGRVDRRATMSADGCFVVFESENDILFADDENAANNIFRLDRCSPGQPLALVSMSQSGEPAEAGSDNFGATISAD